MCNTKQFYFFLGVFHPFGSNRFNLPSFVVVASLVPISFVHVPATQPSFTSRTSTPLVGRSPGKKGQ